MRRALCVGIDRYPFDPLRGCVSDAMVIARLLSRHEDGSRNFDCKPLVAPSDGAPDSVTRSSLRKAIVQLFADKADVALLHFSGHGTENNLGGYLVTQDATAYDEGVAMAEVLQMANDSKSDEVVITLDCCHSGHLGAAPVVDNSKAILREGISILTASRGDQVSVETSGGGLFTSIVADALGGAAADLLGHVTASSVYAFVEAALGGWDQRPLYKSYVSKVIPLRKCTPPIAVSILRELPLLFPLPAEDLPLSPEYETSCDENVPGKVAEFCKLQALSRVHLVIPVGVDHMYDAAVQSKSCRLTATGRYYWRLAADGRF